MADTRSVSRLISLMLRHRPDEFGLVMDKYGFVPLAQLAQAVQKRFDDVTEEQIIALARAPGQHRFELTDKGIRALYGHSFLVEMDGPPMDPPELLYMGSTAEAARRFRSRGIGPGDRFYVHLSLTYATAAGRSRETAGPVVVEVRAREAAAAGTAFYERGEVVLVREIAAQFVGKIHGVEEVPHSVTPGGQPLKRAEMSFGRKLRRDTRR